MVRWTKFARMRADDSSHGEEPSDRNTVTYQNTP